MPDTHPSAASYPISRRAILSTFGAAGFAAIAGACANTSHQPATSASASKADAFAIPSPAHPLPTAKTNLRWIDSGDAKAFFLKPYFAAYHRKHPNITINYQPGGWNNVTQVVTLGVRNGSAPDVFQSPPQIPLSEAVANGWVGAYDDIIPNLAELKKNFSLGSFASGGNMFNGKTYGMPMISGQVLNNMLLFNTKYAKHLDVDLATQIMSWDDFRAATRKLTKQGKGQYYGIVFCLAQASKFSQQADAMAEMSGLHGGVSGINWRTGEYNFTDPMALEAIEVLMAMRDDKVVLPGSTSLDEPGARAKLPQGQAAMIINGPWNIPLWQQQNPTFAFDVNRVPLKDPKDAWPQTYAAGKPGWLYYAKSKAAPVIGDLMAYWATPAAQVIWTQLDGCADASPIPKAAAQAKLNPLQAKALKMGYDYTIVAPSPAVRNAAVTQALLLQKPPQPNFGDVMAGLYTKQITSSIPQAMKSCKDRYDKSLDAAIAAARKNGAKVSRQDWVFSDWDPHKPYNQLYSS